MADKKEIPTILFLVALGLVLFFLYALIDIGIDVHQTIATNRGTVAMLANACLEFLGDNKIVIAVGAAVLVAVKLFIRAPGPARS